MATTKCLLYCTKVKPYLIEYESDNDYFAFLECRLEENTKKLHFGEIILNGKIVAECEIETEKLKKLSLNERRNGFLRYENEEEILKESCLSGEQLRHYLRKTDGYALHIKNLKEKILSFDKDCIFKKPHGNEVITRAPQNMQWCFDRRGNRYALISIRPEWLCKILNEEKTIEIRKKVLKGMCDDE